MKQITKPEAESLIAAMRAAVVTVPSYLERYKRDKAVRDDDLQAHLEDEGLVNQVIDGQLVPCHWSDLPADQQQSARINTFHLYSF